MALTRDFKELVQKRIARDPAFGDWATNLAMVLAKSLGQKPRP